MASSAPQAGAAAPAAASSSPPGAKAKGAPTPQKPADAANTNANNAPPNVKNSANQAVPVLLTFVDVHHFDQDRFFFAEVSNAAFQKRVIGRAQTLSIDVKFDTELTIRVYESKENVYDPKTVRIVGKLRIPMAKVAQMRGLYRQWFNLDAPDAAFGSAAAREFERSYMGVSEEVFAPKLCLSITPGGGRKEGATDGLPDVAAVLASQRQLEAYVDGLHTELMFHKKQNPYSLPQREASEVQKQIRMQEFLEKEGPLAAFGAISPQTMQAQKMADGAYLEQLNLGPAGGAPLGRVVQTPVHLGPGKFVADGGVLDNLAAAGVDGARRGIASGPYAVPDLGVPKPPSGLTSDREMLKAYYVDTGNVSKAMDLQSGSKPGKQSAAAVIEKRQETWNQLSPPPGVRTDRELYAPELQTNAATFKQGSGAAPAAAQVDEGVSASVKKELAGGPTHLQTATLGKSPGVAPRDVVINAVDSPLVMEKSLDDIHRERIAELQQASRAMPNFVQQPAFEVNKVASVRNIDGITRGQRIGDNLLDHQTLTSTGTTGEPAPPRDNGPLGKTSGLPPPKGAQRPLAANRGLNLVGGPPPLMDSSLQFPAYPPSNAGLAFRGSAVSNFAGGATPNAGNLLDMTPVYQAMAAPDSAFRGLVPDAAARPGGALPAPPVTAQAVAAGNALVGNSVGDSVIVNPTAASAAVPSLGPGMPGLVPGQGVSAGGGAGGATTATKVPGSARSGGSGGSRTFAKMRGMGGGTPSADQPNKNIVSTSQFTTNSGPFPATVPPSAGAQSKPAAAPSSAGGGSSSAGGSRTFMRNRSDKPLAPKPGKARAAAAEGESAGAPAVELAEDIVEDEVESGAGGKAPSSSGSKPMLRAKGAGAPAAAAATSLDAAAKMRGISESENEAAFPGKFAPKAGSKAAQAGAAVPAEDAAAAPAGAAEPSAFPSKTAATPGSKAAAAAQEGGGAAASGKSAAAAGGAAAGEAKVAVPEAPDTKAAAAFPPGPKQQAAAKKAAAEQQAAGATPKQPPFAFTPNSRSGSAVNDPRQLASVAEENYNSGGEGGPEKEPTGAFGSYHHVSSVHASMTEVMQHLAVRHTRMHKALEAADSPLMEYKDKKRLRNTGHDSVLQVLDNEAESSDSSTLEHVPSMSPEVMRLVERHSSKNKKKDDDWDDDLGEDPSKKKKKKKSWRETHANFDTLKERMGQSQSQLPRGQGSGAKEAPSFGAGGGVTTALDHLRASVSEAHERGILLGDGAELHDAVEETLPAEGVRKPPVEMYYEPRSSPPPFQMSNLRDEHKRGLLRDYLVDRLKLDVAPGPAGGGPEGGMLKKPVERSAGTAASHMLWARVRDHLGRTKIQLTRLSKESTKGEDEGGPGADGSGKNKRPLTALQKQKLMEKREKQLRSLVSHAVNTAHADNEHLSGAANTLADASTPAHAKIMNAHAAWGKLRSAFSVKTFMQKSMQSQAVAGTDELLSEAMHDVLQAVGEEANRVDNPMIKDALHDLDLVKEAIQEAIVEDCVSAVAKEVGGPSSAEMTMGGMEGQGGSPQAGGGTQGQAGGSSMKQEMLAYSTPSQSARSSAGGGQTGGFNPSLAAVPENVEGTDGNGATPRAVNPALPRAVFNPALSSVKRVVGAQRAVNAFRFPKAANEPHHEDEHEVELEAGPIVQPSGDAGRNVVSAEPPVPILHTAAAQILQQQQPPVATFSHPLLPAPLASHRSNASRASSAKSQLSANPEMNRAKTLATMIGEELQEDSSTQVSPQESRMNTKIRKAQAETLTKLLAEQSKLLIQANKKPSSQPGFGDHHKGDTAESEARWLQRKEAEKARAAGNLPESYLTAEEADSLHHKSEALVEQLATMANEGNPERITALRMKAMVAANKLAGQIQLLINKELIPH